MGNISKDNIWYRVFMHLHAKATDCVLNGSLGGVCYVAENVYMGAGSQINFDYEL